MWNKEKIKAGAHKGPALRAQRRSGFFQAGLIKAMTSLRPSASPLPGAQALTAAGPPAKSGEEIGKGRWDRVPKSKSSDNSEGRTLPAPLSRLRRSGMLRGVRFVGQAGDWGVGEPPQIIPGLEGGWDTPKSSLGWKGSVTVPNPSPGLGGGCGSPQILPGWERTRTASKSSRAWRGLGQPQNPL